jgi:hypothetical protein
MKSIGLLVVALVALSGQAPSSAPASASAPMRTLEYRYGYNVKVASQGTGTGTTTIQILGPAKDGGLMVSGTDFWWNTVRARATNTCEVYANGSVSCAQAPYAISPIQLTIFPMLGASYFSGLSGGSHASWKHNTKVYAAIIPGAAGLASTPTTWTGVMNMQGKGPDNKSGTVVLVQVTGKLEQQGGHYLGLDVKSGIAYDTTAKVPVFVSETRRHLPQTNVNVQMVQLHLIKDSANTP